MTNSFFRILVAALLTLASGAAAPAGDVLPKRFAADIGRQGGSGSVYLVELQGSTLRYTRDQATRSITPTKNQWRAFRHALDEASIWSWRPEYRAHGPDGTTWSLRIEYPDHTLEAKGYNAYPDHNGNPSEILETRSFTRYLLAVQTLLGDRPFARLVSPLELFDLAKLKLIATHPSRNRNAQWADFRDPTGKVHRVRQGAYIGSQSGVLAEVKSASVSLKEIYKDSGGDWAERVTEVKKMETPDRPAR